MIFLQIEILIKHAGAIFLHKSLKGSTCKFLYWLFTVSCREGILTTKTGKQGHLFFTPWNDLVYLFWDKWPFKFKFEKFHAIILGSAIYHPGKFLFFYLGNQFISVYHPRKLWIFIWESIYLSFTILAIQSAIWIIEANTNTITIIINLRTQCLSTCLAFSCRPCILFGT